ncbi:BadM/Rrf2 family transcriptional regulator [Azospirillaceae bacterium]
MIKLTKLADYAVILMSEMARRPEDLHAFHTAPQLAERTGISVPTVAKVLKTLARTTLLESQRGAAGGYCLERPPERISIAEIITALDGPIAIMDCVKTSEASCYAQESCGMRGHWEKINLAVRGVLETVSLADMMTPPDWARTPTPQIRRALIEPSANQRP